MSEQNASAIVGIDKLEKAMESIKAIMAELRQLYEQNGQYIWRVQCIFM